MDIDLHNLYLQQAPLLCIETYTLTTYPILNNLIFLQNFNKM